MRLLLIRHGQTPANVRGDLDTASPGPGLTDLGRRQAEALAHALRDEPISGVYVSRLTRTHLTAAPLAAARGLTPVELAGIHEIEAGDFEGRRDPDAVRGYFGTVVAWVEGDLARAMPGGANGASFFSRFDGALGEIGMRHAPDATVAVVSHGAAIRVWAGARVPEFGREFAASSHLDNTGVVAVEGTPGSADGATPGRWRGLSWAGVPVGGAALRDPAAGDVTGDPVDDALASGSGRAISGPDGAS